MATRRAAGPIRFGFRATLPRQAGWARRAWTLTLICAGWAAWLWWDDWFEKRVVVIEPGGLVRGAWQKPGPLRRLLEREGIRSIVTLTAINPDDPKYVGQANALAGVGRPIRWIQLDWRGSTATLEQMAQAADLLADQSLRPIFFHCVAGHHRTGLAHAAYLIRHRGFTAAQAWDQLSRLPWTDPDHPRDRADRELIRRFEAWNAQQSRPIYVHVNHDGPPQAKPGDRRRGL